MCLRYALALLVATNIIWASADLAKDVVVNQAENPSEYKKIEISGKIEEMPKGSSFGLWTINGKKVFVFDQTTILPGFQAAKTGARATVEGYAVGDIIEAQTIRIEP